MTALTIVIPSYNRADILRANLEKVANRLPSGLILLILDNHSEPAVSLPESLLNEFASRQITVRLVRNPTNIGAPANLMRCFELVTTPWFILSGDDDVLVPEVVGELPSIIQRHSTVGFIKFSSRFHHYSDESFGATLGDLLESHANFTSLMFMSSFAFRSSACLPYLRYGYMEAGANAAHLAVAMLAAQKHGFVESPLEVAVANAHDAEWSPLDVYLSFYYLSDLPLTRGERLKLQQLIYKTHNIGREVLDVSSIFQTPSTRDEALFLREKAIYVHLRFGRGLRSLGAVLLLALAPYSGRVGLCLLLYLYRRATGRAYTRAFTSRHARL